jgi:FRG domain
MQNDLMGRLARRTRLAKKFGLRYIDGCWPYLEIGHPGGITRLIGEAKRQFSTSRLLLRGQVQHHDGMLPSLFRDKDVEPAKLREAESAFAARIRQTIRAGRFNRDDLPALLQYYGFRTSWLDTVDNLFVATWFATNKLGIAVDSFIETSLSSGEHGWLFLIASRIGSRRLRHIDFRSEHHPLSSRPHVQHGVSLAGADTTECDLRDFVVGTIRFPTSSCTVTGTLFEKSFLFPFPEDDHTLRLLVRHQANDWAAAIEREYRLPSGALGRVSQLRSVV